MNLKSKIFGLAAATALSISIMTGAMAADTSVPVTAKLEGGQCAVAVTSGDINFGTWNYNGTSKSYVWDNTASGNQISASLTEGNPSGCNVNIKFAGLNGRSGNIGLSNFSASIEGTQLPSLPAALATTGLGANGVRSDVYDATLNLNTVPSNYLPGTYNGSIVVGVSNTQ